MMEPANATRKATRQCWECLKRRLVCDYTMPHCNKCVKKGRECPGYDAKKPLQWVETGKITSRKRTKPSKKSELSITVLDSRPLQMDSSSDSSRSHYTDSSGERSDEDHHVDANEQRMIYHSSLAKIESPEEADRVISIESKEQIKKVLKNGSREEAAKMLSLERDPLKGLRRVLRYMHMENLPTYNLRSEACEVVQAIHYCTSRPISTKLSLFLLHVTCCFLHAKAVHVKANYLDAYRLCLC